jgi:hypothetical protein
MALITDPDRLSQGTSTAVTGVLVSITLSGVLPVGVKTVKTLSYSAGVLTGATYS